MADRDLRDDGYCSESLSVLVLAVFVVTKLLPHDSPILETFIDLLVSSKDVLAHNSFIDVLS